MSNWKMSIRSLLSLLSLRSDAECTTKFRSRSENRNNPITELAGELKKNKTVLKSTVFGLAASKR